MHKAQLDSSCNIVVKAETRSPSCTYNVHALGAGFEALLLGPSNLVSSCSDSELVG